MSNHPFLISRLKMPRRTRTLSNSRLGSQRTRFVSSCSRNSCEVIELSINEPHTHRSDRRNSPLQRLNLRSSRPKSKRGKGKGIGQGIGPNSPLLPIGAASSSLLGPGVPPGRVSESSVRSGARLEVSGPGVGPRPRSAGSATGKKVQRESILRYDGMLVQHLAAEKDRMKRITHDYASSATNSPVQPPSGPSSSVARQMPFSAVR